MAKFAWYVVVIILQYCASGESFERGFDQRHHDHAGDIAPLYKVVHGIEGLREVLPLPSLREPVNVSLVFSLLSVLSVRDHDHVVEVAGWQMAKWHDHRLIWHHTPDYQNITNIHLSVNDLWIPDLALYNSVNTDRSFFLDKTPAPVLVTNHGDVTIVAPVTYRVQCDSAILDSHPVLQCDIKIGSWTYNGYQVNLHADDQQELDLSNYKPRGGVLSEYQILRTEINRNVQMYSCCPEPYVDITYKLFLGRPTDQTKEPKNERTENVKPKNLDIKPKNVKNIKPKNVKNIKPKNPNVKPKDQRTKEPKMVSSILQT